MGFSNDLGYSPLTVKEIIEEIILGINEEFSTTYTYDSFLGTNMYKYMYSLAQKVQSDEIKTAEILLNLQDYFNVTNESISEPKTVASGLIATILAAGYVASIKPPADADAGKIYCCVDVDETDPDYATHKLAINTILKDYTVAGTVTQGTESSSITLTNGQTFTFKYGLPTRTALYLRISITTSRNNQLLIDSPTQIKTKLLANIASRYGLGKDFEPEIYFDYVDAPYAGNILLEHSLNGSTGWTSATIAANYNEIYLLDDARITVVQA
jgi:hypothetical protein